MKNLSLIACISRDGGLGMGNHLLWRIPEDMQFFKQTTMGGVVVMGRRTFESIGNPLPGRQNVVLSSRPLDTPGIEWCESSSDLDEYLATRSEPVFIIGGASLYTMYIDRVNKLYLTEVDGTQPADTYFPEFDKSKFLRRVIKSGEQDGIKYNIIEYTRKP